MPSPERGPGGPEEPVSREHEPVPYYRAARFAGERPAGVAYVQAQEAVYAAAGAVDVSVYRFQLDRIYHVAVLGQPPPPELDATLATILAAGEPATLPTPVLRQLAERRAEATKHGPWVQRHYRPGQRL